MRRRVVKDLGASVRARLTNIAKETKRDFDAILLQYFQERFLYRLSLSPYRSAFVLKGALLFLVYEMPFLRPTKDIDFLVRSKSKDSSAVGEKVNVEPIVTIPGWFVKRTSLEGMPVLNPKKGIESYITSKRKSILSDAMITRIVHQVDQRCRNIEPKGEGYA